MTYYQMMYVLENRQRYWSNSMSGSGDASVDANPQNDPNEHLQPLAGNKFYQIIAIIAVIGLSVALVVMASKKQNA